MENCTKVKYATEEAVRSDLIKYQKERFKSPQKSTVRRYYKCPICNSYHLTSKGSKSNGNTYSAKLLEDENTKLRKQIYRYQDQIIDLQRTIDKLKGKIL